MIKRVFKILSLTAASVIILLILLIFIIRAGFLNNYIAGTVSKIAGRSLNGELEIGSLKGNIFSSFSIHDIVITSDSDTILRCDEIEVSYLPYSLLNHELDISRLYIDHLSVNLSQNKDSVWNFMNLLKQGEANDTTPAESAWIVNLRDFRLTKLAAGINSVGENQLIPEFITSDIRLGAFMSGDILKVSLDKLTLVTRNPDFQITDFTGAFSKKDDMISWEKIELLTAQSVIITGGKYSLNETGEADLEIEFEPLSLQEFLVFFEGTELHGSPEISASLKGEAKHYYFDVNIAEKEQGISIEGSVKKFRTDPEFSIKMVVKNLDGSYWTGNEKMKSLISGVVDLTGRGFDIKENDLVVSGKFGDVRYGEYRLSDLSISSSKQKDNVVGNIGFNNVAGNLSLRYDIDRIFSNPVYDLNGRFRNVNPEVFMEMDSLETDLNGYFAIKGEGISPETADAEVELRLENSEFIGEPVGDFSILADYNKGDYEFELKDFGIPFFTVSASGDGNIYRANNIDFELKPLDLAGLARAFNLPEVNATGRITGKIEGTTDSLSLSGEMSLAEIRYDSISVKELNSDFKVRFADSLYNIVLNAGGIRYNDLSIRSASLDASMSGRSITAGLEVTVNDSLDAVFSGEIDGFNDPLIKIGRLEIGYSGKRWISRNDSASIHLAKDNIFVDNFSLVSGDQSLNVHGKLSFVGEQDLSLAIDALKLESLPLYLFTSMDISGTLSLKTDITGNSKEPVIRSSINIDDIVLNEYRIDSVRSESAYEKEMLTFSGAVSAYGYRLVDISAGLPVHISLSDSVYVLKDSQALSVSVNIDSVDLKQINEMFPVDNTSFTGMAEASLNISNKVSQPQIRGNLNILNAWYKNTEYGAIFDNIRFKSNIDSNLVTIEEFTATSGKKGTISIQGTVGISDLASIDPSSLGLSIIADDFQLMKSKMAELNFDSDLRISGESGKPTFGGEITINNSEVNVDYFGTYLSEVKDDPNPPLLIKALGDTIKGPLINDTLTIKPGMPGAAFFKNLTGEAVLKIPGNTWARGKDMNVELQGTLRAIKSGEGISLFGDININRGYYKLYGKRFDFSQGKVTFTGGSDLNPNLDFEIIYKFRDIERELKNLKLTVKGNLKEPELGFSLDDRVLEEKDAISYIVFGKSINELSANERSKVAGNEAIAMNAALSGLASVLKDVLQQSAGLDVVEISGAEDWKSTNVTIGKYITNKLYLSYEQSFAFDKQTKVVDTEKFMLEYQILRNLILKATNQDINSGFDLIFRKNWK